MAWGGGEGKCGEGQRRGERSSGKRQGGYLRGREGGVWAQEAGRGDFSSQGYGVSTGWGRSWRTEKS